MENHYRRYCALEAPLEEDPEMKLLKQRLQQEAGELEQVLARLPEPDRTTVTEYLGICAEVSQRIVELVCFLPDGASS